MVVARCGNRLLGAPTLGASTGERRRAPDRGRDPLVDVGTGAPMDGHGTCTDQGQGGDGDVGATDVGRPAGPDAAEYVCDPTGQRREGVAVSLETTRAAGRDSSSRFGG